MRRIRELLSFPTLLQALDPFAMNGQKHAILMISSAISEPKQSSGSSSRKGLLRLAIALVALAGANLGCAQVTATWLGGTGNWSNGLLWVLLVPPQTGSNVIINTPLLPADVTLDNDATIGSLILGSSSKLTLTNGRRLEMGASSTLDGALVFDASGSELRFTTSSLTLSGTGTITMGASSNNRIRGSSSTILTNQVPIQGSGLLGDGSLSLQNQSTITATNASVPLTIRPNSGGVTNTGTLRATGGATLVLKDGVFTNTGGSIVADANSHVDVEKSAINGGLLVSSGTGHFHAIDSALSNVTIGSGTTIEVAGGDTLALLGNILNNGLISMLGASGASELTIGGAVTLSGSGNVTLSNSSANRVSAATTGSVLTIGQSQTISGAGELGRNQIGLTNLGTIVANQSNPLLVDVAGGNFTNSGRLKASGSGGMKLLDSAVVNAGTIEIGVGSLVEVGGAFTQSGPVSAVTLAGGTFAAKVSNVNSGSLGGSGMVTGDVTIGAAAIEPGGVGSIGTLAFNSNLNLGGTSSLYFDLGGTSPGTGYDRITGTSVTLGGSLFLSFINGFELNITPTDTFTLISTSTALNGMFASLPNGARFATLDGLGSFQVNYGLNALTVSNFQPIPEPSTYILLTIGAAGVLLAERRRRRRS
jgi:hypothetical protein